MKHEQWFFTPEQGAAVPSEELYLVPVDPVLYKMRDIWGYDHEELPCEPFDIEIKIQSENVLEGLKIFEQNNIRIEIFFAPNHTYDNNTFKALKNAGIHKIIDGYGIMPFIFDEIKFVPQLFYKLYFLPYGIQSTQIHINNWTEQDFKTFEDFVKKNKKKIISSNFAFSRTSDKFYIKIINNLFKSLLKLKRLLY